ncbi:MAG: CapA family protein [Butyrivibrio sp.]|nr:CapA family protein [Muribaculum sp.]MCM1551479.1 CapA family protein [Butyrivibrio sp.]
MDRITIRISRKINILHIVCALLLLGILSGCASADKKMAGTENAPQSISEDHATSEEMAGTENASQSIPENRTTGEEIKDSENAPKSKAWEHPADKETVSDSTSQTEMNFPSLVPESTGDTAANTISDSPRELTLLMVGDILLHTPVEESALQTDGSYRFDAIFANTRDYIQAADLALVNQEVILGGAELGISGYPAFNAPFEVGDALTDAGFDVICHATNHALDKGRKGILNCISYWQESHPQITVLGINDSEESQSDIYIYKQNDISVAILNYTYGTNGIPLPEDMPYAVNMLDKERVTADIQRAEELADFTIVCPHWGTEYRLTPDSMQEEWTDIFLENGVDLVLGTHPHVIEPIEWVRDEDSGHQMLVYYSLGNYVNWTSGTGEGVANRMVGGMAKITLALDEKGDVVIADYGVQALVCHVEDGVDGVTVYPLSEYSEELEARNAIVSQDDNFSKDYCIRLCEEVWGELWK